MPLDPNLQEAIDKLIQVNADDAAEDAAFEAAIADLQTQIAAKDTQIASVTAERDAANAALAIVTAERDALLTERATTIADLIIARDSLSARITALGG